MDSPRRGDPTSTVFAFEETPRGNATTVARFLHCGSCQKVGVWMWVQGQATGITGLRNDIQKCLREHTKRVGEYQLAQPRKFISESRMAETKPVVSSSVCGECRVEAFLPVGCEQILRLQAVRSLDDSAHL